MPSFPLSCPCPCSPEPVVRGAALVLPRGRLLLQERGHVLVVLLVQRGVKLTPNLTHHHRELLALAG